MIDVKSDTLKRRLQILILVRIMRYEIKYSARALRQLAKLDNQAKIQVLKRLEKLSENPYFAKPLSNKLKNNFSERVGKIRIIFSISGNEIDIGKIEHRKSVYLFLFT